MNTKRLTNSEYWIKYYGESFHNNDVLTRIVGKYDHFWDVLIRSCSRKPKTILEVGAFPGRYLAYLAKKYELRPTGVDFNPEHEKFAATMQTMGITDFDYIVADFLDFRPHQKFDIIISNGFVEHFEDFNKVMDLHTAYLNPGGSLLIMVPNKRYLRYLYGFLFDYENLKLHNLLSMRKTVFRQFAERNKLQVIELSYFGGFPYKLHAPLHGYKRILHSAILRLIKLINPLFSKFPFAWWSSNLIGIFHLPSSK